MNQSLQERPLNCFENTSCFPLHPSHTPKYATSAVGLPAFFVVRGFASGAGNCSFSFVDSALAERAEPFLALGFMAASHLNRDLSVRVGQGWAAGEERFEVLFYLEEIIPPLGGTGGVSPRKLLL